MVATKKVSWRVSDLFLRRPTIGDASAHPSYFLLLPTNKQENRKTKDEGSKIKTKLLSRGRVSCKLYCCLTSTSISTAKKGCVSQQQSQILEIHLYLYWFLCQYQHLCWGLRARAMGWRGCESCVQVQGHRSWESSCLFTQGFKFWAHQISSQLSWHWATWNLSLNKSLSLIALGPKIEKTNKTRVREQVLRRNLLANNVWKGLRVRSNVIPSMLLELKGDVREDINKNQKAPK